MAPAGRLASWRSIIGLSLAWLATLAVVFLMARRPSADPIEILPPPTPSPTPPAGPLHIDVAGAVHKPGVYTLAAGSIVADAIAAAGGPAADADLDQVNKAVLLQDQMQVYVPFRRADGVDRPDAAPNPPAGASGAAFGLVQQAPSRSAPIDINTATQTELEGLPGIGPVLAQRIIDGRPYARVEDLLAVSGIGSTTFDKLKDLVTVR